MTSLLPEQSDVDGSADHENIIDEIDAYGFDSLEDALELDRDVIADRTRSRVCFVVLEDKFAENGRDEKGVETDGDEVARVLACQGASGRR